MRPQFKLSKNQEIEIHWDTNWKIQLIHMKLQFHNSSELPLEHNENQEPLSNQIWVWPYLTNLRVKGKSCSFSLGIKGKEDNVINFKPQSSKYLYLNKEPYSYWFNIFYWLNMPFFYFSNTIVCHISSRTAIRAGSNPERFEQSLRSTLLGRNSKFTIFGKSNWSSPKLIKSKWNKQ